VHFFWLDLRYGARMLAKAPAFMAVALLTLALGMGAATAIFSVVDTVLLKPLPFRDAERLLVIWEQNVSQNLDRTFVSPADFLAWQQHSRAVERMAALQDARINLTGGPNGHIDPEEIKVERVTANLFPLLGVVPPVGRAFQPEEDRPGNTNFVLLSHSLWERRFGGDPGIAGRTIRLRDHAYTVVGVLPAAFAVTESGVDAFVPLGLNPADAHAVNNRFLKVIARRRGSLDQVREELDALGAQLERAQPALNTGWRPEVFELGEELVGGVRRSLWVLMAAVGCLLLMACVNVANLLLARGATRAREIALRSALGAGRGRIVMQLLTESVLLALGGAALGWFLAAGANYLLVHAGPASVPRLAEAALDLRLFGFALAISLATGILFGIVPALQGARTSLSVALNEGGRGGSAGRTGRRIRNTLVSTEVALAVVVLIAAGLLMRSFIRLRGVDPGFRPASVLTVRVPLAGGHNGAMDRRIAFFRQVTDRIATLPGVRTVGAVNALPLTGLDVGATFAVVGRPATDQAMRPVALSRSITPGYFAAMGIPLLAGRALADSDTAQSAPVVVVSQTLARRFWPSGGAVGGRLAIDLASGARVAEIVGVVGDTKAEGIDGEEWPTIFTPYPQLPSAAMTLTVRTAGPPLALASAVTGEVHRLDPDQPVADLRPMEEVVNLALAGARFNTVLLMSFAGVAFLLAAVGIYGVISYDVSQRTNEIGIRMALGAQPADVRRLIVGQGARLAVYGIGAGLLGAGLVTRFMRTMLFGVHPADAWTYAAISILLALVALGASFGPSRRAMALDPVTALRHE
jgi:putative ABC transport system permease protein